MQRSLRDELAYYSHYGWVRAKQALGMPLIGDKRHMGDRLVRGVRAGRISPETVLAVEIRRDGVGSQALSRLSVEATARDLGLRYAHRPFEAIAHAEGDPNQWVSRCEAAFALGVGRPRVEDFDLSMVTLTEFACNRSLWSSPHVVAIGNMYVHCDRDPAIYGHVIASRTRAPRSEGPLKIAAHVRRGDVTARQVSHRFTSNDAVLTTLKQLAARIDAIGLLHEVTIYSNGEPSEFEEFSSEGFRVDLVSGALEVFEALRNADVLLTAKSTFSYVAGLYSNAIVLYEPFARRPPPTWIVRSPDGRFATEVFDAQLRTMIAGRA